MLGSNSHRFKIHRPAPEPPAALTSHVIAPLLSRSQREITCATNREIINNSAADCLLSLKFHTDFDHVTLDVPQTFKVNWSQRDIHNVSASKKRYNSGTDKLSKVKLDENYLTAERNTLHGVQGHKVEY